MSFGEQVFLLKHKETLFSLHGRVRQDFVHACRTDYTLCSTRFEKGTEIADSFDSEKGS